MSVSNLWENQKYSYKKLATFDTSAGQANAKPDLDDAAPATPCGLIAKSLFNDTFELYFSTNKADFASNPTKLTNTAIDMKNIAWSSDVEYKFKNTPGDWQSN